MYIQDITSKYNKFESMNQLNISLSSSKFFFDDLLLQNMKT